MQFNQSPEHNVERVRNTTFKCSSKTSITRFSEDSIKWGIKVESRFSFDLQITYKTPDRCIGLAVIENAKDKKQYDFSSPDNFIAIEQGMTFVGVVAMLDPPRPEVLYHFVQLQFCRWPFEFRFPQQLRFASKQESELLSSLVITKQLRNQSVEK